MFPCGDGVCWSIFRNLADWFCFIFIFIFLNCGHHIKVLMVPFWYMDVCFTQPIIYATKLFLTNRFKCVCEYRGRDRFVQCPWIYSHSKNVVCIRKRNWWMRNVSCCAVCVCMCVCLCVVCIFPLLMINYIFQVMISSYNQFY